MWNKWAFKHLGIPFLFLSTKLPFQIINFLVKNSKSIYNNGHRNAHNGSKHHHHKNLQKDVFQTVLWWLCKERLKKRRNGLWFGDLKVMMRNMKIINLRWGIEFEALKEKFELNTSKEKKKQKSQRNTRKRRRRGNDHHYPHPTQAIRNLINPP